MTRSATTLLLLLAGVLPARASAESGSIDLPRFHVVHTDRAGSAAARLSRTLEDERNALAVKLGRDWDGKVEVRVAEGWEDARALPAGGSDALLLDSRALSGDEGAQALRHGLAHLALSRLGHWPRWFAEGFAAQFAGEEPVAAWLAGYRSTRPESAIPLEALSTAWPDRLAEVEVAYAQSRDFVAFLEREHGDAALRDLVGKVSGGADFDAAFREVYHRDLLAAETQWRGEVGGRWAWLRALTHPLTLGLGFAALCALTWLRLRQRRRLQRAELELEEKAEEAALRIAAAEQLRPNPTPIGGEDEPRPPSKPVLH